MEARVTFALVGAGFLDEHGVRWTAWIPLLTGRFGVRVPGGARTRTGPCGPVLSCCALHGVIAAPRQQPMAGLPGHPRASPATARLPRDRSAEPATARIATDRPDPGRFVAISAREGGSSRVDLGVGPDVRCLRRSRTFDSRERAEARISRQRAEHDQLTEPITDERLADELRR